MDKYDTHIVGIRTDQTIPEIVKGLSVVPRGLSAYYRDNITPYLYEIECIIDCFEEPRLHNKCGGISLILDTKQFEQLERLKTKLKLTRSEALRLASFMFLRDMAVEHYGHRIKKKDF